MAISAKRLTVVEVPSAKESSGDEVLSGMVCVDTSGNPRIPILMEMVAALSRATEPNEMLRGFAEGFHRLYGPSGYVSLSTRGLAPGEYKITRLLTGNLVNEMGRTDPWKQWSQLPVHRGGFFGQIIRTAYPQIVNHLNVRNDPVVGDALAEYGSLLAIPLFDKGEPLNWSITLRKEPEGYTVEELEESILRSNLGGWAVKNALISGQLREAHTEIRREVDQIAKIQRALLPASIPDIPGLDIDVNYETFDQAGGDMYSLRPLWPIRPGVLLGEGCCDPEGPWAILVGDVSGHGPAAAVVMAMMQSIIEAYPREPAGPAEVLEHANHYLCAKRIESRFVTAFLAIYDPVTRRFTYARAGHNPPVLMKPVTPGSGWTMARLDANGNIPLGITEGVTYDETTITLEPGQTLVLYTDGITEAMSPEGRMFGVEGIEASLTECTGYPQCAIGHITTTLKEHEAGIRPNDDQTIIVMRVE